jgi:5-methylcytosine-specific restriction enzyme subunit McrC
MLYASDLTRVKGLFDGIMDNNIDDIPDLIARLLADAVERRLRRNFTKGYYHREKELTRVRGRINFLKTESRQLLSKGEVFCRYEELTLDTARNRFVRVALELMARMVQKKELIRQCRALAATLSRAGVSGSRPSRAELAADQIGRNDTDDRFMIALAHLAFDLALPTEDSGTTPLSAPDREETWVRRLFEKAILGFARVELEPLGWSVRGGTPLTWPFLSASPGLAPILPRMVTDIMLDTPKADRRLVIDTKFTSIVRSSRFGEERLKSEYLYQMYAYLRSQEGRGHLWDTSAGLFLHPAIGSQLHEQLTIQGHSITFTTIDLSGQSNAIRNELRSILNSSFWLKTENQQLELVSP